MGFLRLKKWSHHQLPSQQGNLLIFASHIGVWTFTAHWKKIKDTGSRGSFQASLLDKRRTDSQGDDDFYDPFFLSPFVHAFFSKSIL